MDENPNKVVSFGNRILFYAEVNTETTVTLMEELYKLRDDPVSLHIHSAGGDAQLGLTLADELHHREKPVQTVADGWVGSAATFFFLSGHKRLMRVGTQLLIHSLSGQVEGYTRSMWDDLKMYENLSRFITDLYLDRTRLSEQQVVSMMERETWLSYEQALQHGMVDGLYVGY